eukprot:365505-Chlamydomonas_euryale.AAC.6
MARHVPHFSHAPPHRHVNTSQLQLCRVLRTTTRPAAHAPPPPHRHANGSQFHFRRILVNGATAAHGLFTQGPPHPRNSLGHLHGAPDREKGSAARLWSQYVELTSF